MCETGVRQKDEQDEVGCEYDDSLYEAQGVPVVQRKELGKESFATREQTPVTCPNTDAFAARAANLSWLAQTDLNYVILMLRSLIYSPSGGISLA
jgi:hypothetical protein